MGRNLALLLLLVVVGCEKKEPEPRFEGPMPIAYGDCAATTVAWIAGPRPLPFTPGEAEGRPEPKTEVATTEPPKPPPEPQDDPPPPSEPDDESGGTGTRQAPEEGKMGRQKSERQSGRYKMKRNPDSPQRARQQAIEAARSAGILGTSAQQQGGAFASLTGTGDISSGFDDSNIYGGLLGNEAGEMNGGFGYGRSGFGPGGGGTGWGTIGKGRYGTIGHGSGTGSGYGVGGGRGGMRGRTSAVPTVSIGQPNASGDLDKAIIRRYIKRNHQKLQYCYDKELLVKPQLHGTVMVSFFIGGNGKVVTASANGVDPNVASCVADVIKGIEFPEPRNKGNVQVNYPFTFRPAEGDVTPVTGSGSATAGSADPTPEPTAGSATAGSATTGSATAGSAALEDARRLFRSSEWPSVDAAGYKPGANHPMRASEAALVECLRKYPEHHGVAVIELAYDGAGAVTKAAVHGMNEHRATTCIIDVAKRAKRVAPAAVTSERCSFAFGQMPVTALPALDIDAAAIKLTGTVLATGASLTGEDDPMKRRISSVVDAVAARVKLATAGNGPVVALHGPLVVRAASATPMKIVDRALASVIEGGDDFVLAIRKQDWELVTPMALPVVPVPFGTGGRWHRVKSKSRDVWQIVDDERPTLSILVGKASTHVGVSRVNEIASIAEADVAATLRKALEQHKASTFFKDRVDIEIAGDADATYAQFVRAIEAAVAAGFTEWRHADPHGLAVLFTQ